MKENAEWEEWEKRLETPKIGACRSFKMPMYDPDINSVGARISYVVMGAWGTRTIMLDTTVNLEKVWAIVLFL